MCVPNSLASDPPCEYCSTVERALYFIVSVTLSSYSEHTCIRVYGCGNTAFLQLQVAIISILRSLGNKFAGILGRTQGHFRKHQDLDLNPTPQIRKITRLVALTNAYDLQT